ncbi:MAG: N-6 DNA methylase [Sulfurovum sp.]|nr:MAG: N-6 DNA methylase [Sulfurovum sp.]
MTKEELKKLEDNLWDSANTLRATGGIKSADYAVPVLGIIFLRFADNKYAVVEDDIKKEYEKHKGTRAEVSMEKLAIKHCGLYLSAESRYAYLLNLPKDQSLATAIKKAMEDIESHQDAQFQDILPTDAYAQIEANNAEILPELLKNFSDIPKNASGDVFGKIYEYFLGKFALSEGQKGGEFFTPTSVVKFIVEAIEPYKGKIFDPACGSGGMFVQSANFIEKYHKNRDAIRVYGQEHEQSTVKLAKMNLLVNNLKGEIRKANSYEDDCYKSENQFDFVMANPPFNVKGVKESTVKNDTRFTHYGLPKAKGKKDDKITDANYLWISLFATSLNDKGRAGFVMPNSASDARNSEYEIRKKLVDSGIVDCMVSIPSNMFYTVTLPATLWFFDKQKQDKEKILFIDARSVYTQIDRAHREWSEEQVQNLACIVKLRRGEGDVFLQTVADYIEKFQENLSTPLAMFTGYVEQYNALVLGLQNYANESKDKRKADKQKVLDDSGLLARLDVCEALKSVKLPNVKNIASFDVALLDNDKQHTVAKEIASTLESLQESIKTLTPKATVLLALFKEGEKLLRVKGDKSWDAGHKRGLESHMSLLKEKLDVLSYWESNIAWLQSRFPEAKYADVLGLCKLADREEYADEQDYSLNAGRYVGIALEEDNLTEEEFKALLLEKHEVLMGLNDEAHLIEKSIDKNVNILLSNK